ncbi:MAG: hypothetical protein LLF96_07535 [Eubacteriales bacterium]|nr:hypothetical protein [Eubacteriales bacterium]
MSSQNIRKMVTTAILIALTIVFQLMRPVLGGSNIISTYIIGSLVNLALIVAASSVGLASGVSVAVITPLIALMQGHALLPMVPWIIAGNLVLVLLYALFGQKDKAVLSITWVRWSIVSVFAALIKFAVITLGQALVLTSSKGLAFGVAAGTAAGAQFVQIVTALIGAVLAGIILPMLPANVFGKKTPGKTV